MPRYGLHHWRLQGEALIHDTGFPSKGEERVFKLEWPAPSCSTAASKLTPVSVLLPSPFGASVMSEWAHCWWFFLFNKVYVSIFPLVPFPAFAPPLCPGSWPPALVPGQLRLTGPARLLAVGTCQTHDACVRCDSLRGSSTTSRS